VKAGFPEEPGLFHALIALYSPAFKITQTTPLPPCMAFGVYASRTTLLNLIWERAASLSRE